MGFTLYWNYHTVLPNVFARFAKAASEIIAYPVIVTDTTFEMIVPPEECCEKFYISQGSDGFNFCKTRQLPYTVDVMICMILMYEFGLADNLHLDSEVEMLREALERVNELLPLTCYEDLNKKLPGFANFF